MKKLDLLEAAETIFATFWTKQEMNTTHVTQLHFNSRLFIFLRSNDPISKGQLLLMQIIHFLLFSDLFIERKNDSSLSRFGLELLTKVVFSPHLMDKMPF